MTSASSGLTRNLYLLCAFHALFGALFPVAIFSLFWTVDLRMSVTTMLTVQGFFGLVLALAEFPSGYVADRLGHHVALIAGALAVCLGWLLYALAHGLWGVVLAESVLGVGFALISGADSALLYATLKQLEREVEFARWYGRMRFISQVSEGLSALCAGFLYQRSSRLPFWVDVGVWLLALLVLLAIRPPARASARIESHLGRMRGIVRHALQESPALRKVLLLTTTFNVASFIPIWLIVLYAKDAGMPTAWLGPFWAVANFVVAFGALCGDRASSVLGYRGTLIASVALIAVGYLGLGASHAVSGALFYYCLTFMRGLHGPLLHHHEQRLIPDSDRAGFLSFRSFLFRGALVVIGPVVGVAVDQVGQRPVLLVAGAVCTLVGLGLVGVGQKEGDRLG